MHQLPNAGEAATELTARVQIGKVLCLEAESVADVDGESVAQREHGGCRGRGRELERTGFAGDADVERHDAGLRERGRGASAKTDESRPDAGNGGQEAEQFFGLAAVGEGEEDVAAAEDADIAVEGFAGVEKLRGSAGGDEGSGNLAGDEAAFADSCEDDAVAVLGGVDEHGAGAVEGVVHGAVGTIKAVRERVKSGGFDADKISGGFDTHTLSKC